MAEQKAPRVIKRYANRKLYDMSESCYITHDEIAALVRGGEEIRIIDNRTKEDLTTATLTQILFEKERKIRRGIPLDTLRNIFQTGGEFVQNLRDDVEKKLPKVFRGRDKDREHDEGEAPRTRPEPEPPEPAAPAVAPHAGPKAKPAEALREWVSGTQVAYETLQKSVEDRWNVMVSYLGQFDINHRRIAELERRVAHLETQLVALGGDPHGADDAEESDD